MIGRIKLVRVLICFAVGLGLLSADALAGGGWTRDSGSVYVKLGVTSLSTRSYHDITGKSFAVPGISTQTVSLYSEFGIDSRSMIIVDAPLFKTATYTNAGSANGVGDLGIGFMYGVKKGDWPIAIGILIELPTGNPDRFVTSPTGELHNLPTGDGEMNAWLRGAISHSFWPAPFYATIEGGYNFRSIAVKEFTQQHDGGKFTNNYVANVEFGYNPITELWLTTRVRFFGPAGNPVLGRYSYFGQGEGVQYIAYYLSAGYAVSSNVTVNVDYSSAFMARAIFGGSNLMAGVSYTWR